MVKVSVIVPVYNVQEYLGKCLESLTAQTLKDIEIICVDDGSTDDSLAILRDFAKKDKRIKVLTQQNQYAGAARNAGLKIAKGEFLCFLDSDDFFEQEMLEEMYVNARSNESDIVVCGYCRYNQQIGADTKKHYLNAMLPLNRYVVPEEMGDQLFNLCSPGPWNKLIRRRLFTDNNLHFENFKKCNDLTCIYLTLATAGRISFVNKPFVHYRYNTGNQTSTDRFGENEYFIHAAAALEKHLQDLGIYEKFYDKMFYTLGSSLRWETNDNIKLLYEAAKEELSPRLFHDLYETKRFYEIKYSDVPKCVHQVKLFSFLTLYSWQEQGENKVWYFCGVPVLKRRALFNGVTTKYFVWGLPIIKVSHKLKI